MLCFRSEGSEDEGRPATASHHAGSSTHGQAGCKANWLQPRPHCKGAAGCGQAPYKGRPPAGAVARKRAARCERGASWKVAYGHKHRPLPAASPQGVACPWRGRRGSAYPWLALRGAATGGQGQPPLVQGHLAAVTQKGARDLWHSF
ncbi:hypothetical protein GW17_00028354 [Ensete ventricosum]|nr:hypothetical protein GW17_00028354 [Ensete ventricosum]